MSEEHSGNRSQDPKLVARIIHLAIATGLLLFFAVFFYLRDSGAGLGFSGEQTRVWRLAVYALLVITIVAVFYLRARMPARTLEMSSEVWWTANLPRAVVAWALTEGGGLVAVFVGWLMGSLDLMVLGVALGLGLLFISRPARLEGEHRV